MFQTHQSAYIAHTLLATLINKTTFRKSNFVNDTNYSDSLRWTNFAQLHTLVRRFVFETEWWRDPTCAEQADSALFFWLLSSTTADRERIEQQINEHTSQARQKVLCRSAIPPVRKFLNIDSTYVVHHTACVCLFRN